MSNHTSCKIIIVAFIVIGLLVLLLLVYFPAFSRRTQTITFLLQVGPGVLYKTLLSKNTWGAFLEAGKNVMPLRCHDQTGGVLRHKASVVMINHPWCARWMFSDQLALGSLPKYLTQSMKIIAGHAPPWNPRSMVLNRLDKNRVLYVEENEHGQYTKMRRIVQNIKSTASTLLVYPEGTNSRMYMHSDAHPVLTPFKTGIFRAIYEQNVPVIPVVLPLQWQPGADLDIAIEILPPIYPLEYLSSQEFTASVFDAMMRQLLFNKKQAKQ